MHPFPHGILEYSMQSVPSGPPPAHRDRKSPVSGKRGVTPQSNGRATNLCTAPHASLLAHRVQTAVRASSPSLHTPSGGLIQDDEVDGCMSCGGGFTVFSRRHHCRLCGCVMCHECAENFMSVQIPSPQSSSSSTQLSSSNISFVSSTKGSSGPPASVCIEVRTCSQCYALYQYPVVRILHDMIRRHRGPRLSRLSAALIHMTISYLSPHEITGSIGAACRTLYFMCRDNKVWGPLYHTRMGIQATYESLDSPDRTHGSNARRRAHTPHHMHYYECYVREQYLEWERFERLARARMESLLARPIRTTVLSAKRDRGVKTHVIDQWCRVCDGDRGHLSPWLTSHSNTNTGTGECTWNDSHSNAMIDAHLPLHVRRTTLTHHHSKGIHAVPLSPTAGSPPCAPLSFELYDVTSESSICLRNLCVENSDALIFVYSSESAESLHEVLDLVEELELHLVSVHGTYPCASPLCVALVGGNAKDSYDHFALVKQARTRCPTALLLQLARWDDMERLIHSLVNTMEHEIFRRIKLNKMHLTTRVDNPLGVVRMTGDHVGRDGKKMKSRRKGWRNSMMRNPSPSHSMKSNALVLGYQPLKGSKDEVKMKLQKASECPQVAALRDTLQAEYVQAKPSWSRTHSHQTNSGAVRTNSGSSLVPEDAMKQKESKSEEDKVVSHPVPPLGPKTSLSSNASLRSSSSSTSLSGASAISSSPSNLREPASDTGLPLSPSALSSTGIPAPQRYLSELTEWSPNDRWRTAGSGSCGYTTSSSRTSSLVSMTYETPDPTIYKVGNIRTLSLRTRMAEVRKARRGEMDMITHDRSITIPDAPVNGLGGPAVGMDSMCSLASTTLSSLSILLFD